MNMIHLSMSFFCSCFTNQWRTIPCRHLTAGHHGQMPWIFDFVYAPSVSSDSSVLSKQPEMAGLQMSFSDGHSQLGSKSPALKHRLVDTKGPAKTLTKHVVCEDYGSWWSCWFEWELPDLPVMYCSQVSNKPKRPSNPWTVAKGWWFFRPYSPCPSLPQCFCFFQTNSNFGPPILRHTNIARSWKKTNKADVAWITLCA